MIAKNSRSVKNYKKGLDGDNCRKRRGDIAVQIRRSRKSEFLAKRRYSDSTIISELAYTQEYERDHVVNVLSNAFISIKSTIPHERLYAAQALRWAISVKNVPVEEALALNESADLLKNLVSLAKFDNRAEVQHEVIWVFSQIAAGKMTKRLADAGAVQTIMKLLQSPSDAVVEECLGCVANVAGDSADLRDQIVQLQGLDFILYHLQRLSSRRSIQHATWALSNLVGSPFVQVPTLAEAARIILRVIQQHLDEKVLSESCWALAHITDKGGLACTKIIMESSCVPVLIRFLAHKNYSIVLPSLQTLANVVVASAEGRDMLLSLDILRSFVNLLDRLSQFAKNQTVWNVQTCGLYKLNQRMRVEIAKLVAFFADPSTTQCIGQIIACDGLVSMLCMEVLNPEWEIRKAALASLVNIILSSSRFQIRQVATPVLVEALCSVLDVADVEVLLASINCLDVVLGICGGMNDDCAVWIEEYGGLDKLENLQGHQSPDIYHACVRLIEKHFNSEMEVEDANIAPAYCSSSNTFEFGLPVYPHHQIPSPAW
jgi:hypothetical protein